MKKISSKLAKLVNYGKISNREYQAYLNGLNIVFGAVLGFVLAGTENLSSLEFGVLLMILAGAVVSILYISSSHHRIAYSIIALLIAYFFPELVEYALEAPDAISEKTRPTLVVWTLISIFVEFWPRNKPDEKNTG